MKKDKTKLSVTIEPKVDKLLEDGGFNKSKLINKLLEEFLGSRKLIPKEFK